MNYKKYYLTSESVTEGHPDKVCDYISDSILDSCLEQDENSRVAIETFISNGKVVVAGTILGGIELRNNWRENGKLEREKEEFPYNEKQIEIIDRYNELQDILDQVECYAETNVFEDEEELE